MSETIYTEQDYIDADKETVKRYEELTVILRRRHDLGPTRIVYVTVYDIVEKHKEQVPPEEYYVGLLKYQSELRMVQDAYRNASEKRRMIERQLRIQKDEEL
jgi:hypothetical protein